MFNVFFPLPLRQSGFIKMHLLATFSWNFPLILGWTQFCLQNPFNRRWVVCPERPFLTSLCCYFCTYGASGSSSLIFLWYGSDAFSATEMPLTWMFVFHTIFCKNSWYCTVWKSQEGDRFRDAGTTMFSTNNNTTLKITLITSHL